MAESHVISALAAKYAELQGRINHIKKPSKKRDMKFQLSQKA